MLIFVSLTTFHFNDLKLKKKSQIKNHTHYSAKQNTFFWIASFYVLCTILIKKKRKNSQPNINACVGNGLYKNFAKVI